MKGLEKLTSIRLAEVLTQKGVVPAETITDALYTQDKHGDPFVDNLISSGHISEWDLARVVVENFQLPFILAGNYELSDEAKAAVDKVLLFKTQLVPLDLFGNILTVAMPILTPYQALAAIQKKFKVQIYPYVGLITENKKVLGDVFPDYKDWSKSYQEEKEKKAAARAQNPKAQEGEGDWMNVFDSGDKAVKSSMKKKR